MNELLWLLGTPQGILCLVLSIVCLLGLVAILVGGVYWERVPAPKEPLVKEEWWTTGWTKF